MEYTLIKTVGEKPIKKIWTIYRNTDPNDPEDRELLDLCIDEGWNASRLKREKYPDTEDSLIQSLLNLTNRFKSSNFIDLQNIAEQQTDWDEVEENEKLMAERDEQIALFNALAYHPELKWAHSVPNGFYSTRSDCPG